MVDFPLSYPTNLRPVDVHRDLTAVADLIELCFIQHMDSDGREYLRQIRRAAQNHNYLRWVAGPNEQVSVPLHGYVWEEKGKVVGNLTLIPFLWQGRWYYMIANVAVHPDFRKRGIARLLTQRALVHIREKKSISAWLQVRDDNPVAHHLYLSIGFTERAWRTNWHSTPSKNSISSLPTEVNIYARRKEDWPQQRIWLQANYPDEVAWNLAFHLDRFSPSLWRRLLRILNNDIIEHWTAHYYKDLIGIATWEPGRFTQDVLWIASTPVWEDVAVRTLLPYLQKSIHSDHVLTVNYPAGHAEAAFEQAGFHKHNTLIWMENNLE